MYDKKHDYVYLIVTADEYELPLAMFEKLEEVSEYTGRSKASINTAICRGDTDKKNNCRYIRIDLKKGKK